MLGIVLTLIMVNCNYKNIEDYSGCTYANVIENRVLSLIGESHDVDEKNSKTRQFDTHSYFESGLSIPAKKAELTMPEKPQLLLQSSLGGGKETKPLPRFNFTALLARTIRPKPKEENPFFTKAACTRKSRPKRVSFNFLEISAAHTHLPFCRRNSVGVSAEYGHLHGPNCKNYPSEKELDRQEFHIRAEFIQTNGVTMPEKKEFFYTPPAFVEVPRLAEGLKLLPDIVMNRKTSAQDSLPYHERVSPGIAYPPDDVLYGPQPSSSSSVAHLDTRNEEVPRENWDADSGVGADWFSDAGSIIGERSHPHVTAVVTSQEETRNAGVVLQELPIREPGHELPMSSNDGVILEEDTPTAPSQSGGSNLEDDIFNTLQFSDSESEDEEECEEDHHSSPSEEEEDDREESPLPIQVIPASPLSPTPPSTFSVATEEREHLEAPLARKRGNSDSGFEEGSPLPSDEAATSEDDDEEIVLPVRQTRQTVVWFKHSTTPVVSSTAVEVDGVAENSPTTQETHQEEHPSGGFINPFTRTPVLSGPSLRPPSTLGLLVSRSVPAPERTIDLGERHAATFLFDTPSPDDVVRAAQAGLVR